MKAFEIRGRHLLGCELDEVGAVVDCAPGGEVVVSVQEFALSE